MNEFHSTEAFPAAELVLQYYFNHSSFNLSTDEQNNDRKFLHLKRKERREIIVDVDVLISNQVQSFWCAFSSSFCCFCHFRKWFLLCFCLERETEALSIFLLFICTKSLSSCLNNKKKVWFCMTDYAAVMHLHRRESNLRRLGNGILTESATRFRCFTIFLLFIFADDEAFVMLCICQFLFSILFKKNSSSLCFDSLGPIERKKSASRETNQQTCIGEAIFWHNKQRRLQAFGPFVLLLTISGGT